DMDADYEINVDLNPEQNNDLTIFINYKIMDDKGTYLGATGVGLNFDTVAKIVTRYEESFGHLVYFMNAAGDTAIRSKNAFITTDNIHDAPGIRAVAPQLLNTGENFSEYRHDGRVMLLSSRY